MVVNIWETIPMPQNYIYEKASQLNNNCSLKIFLYIFFNYMRAITNLCILISAVFNTLSNNSGAAIYPAERQFAMNETSRFCTRVASVVRRNASPCAEMLQLEFNSWLLLCYCETLVELPAAFCHNYTLENKKNYRRLFRRSNSNKKIYFLFTYFRCLLWIYCWK